MSPETIPQITETIPQVTESIQQTVSLVIDWNEIIYILVGAIIGFLASIIVLVVERSLDKKGKIKLSRPENHHISYTVCKRMLTTVIILAILASINFTWTFELFHKTIFMGKTNWGFAETLDPIILALPESSFRNCAILIVSSIVVICVSFIIYNKMKENRRD